jgi:hypothetical protein
VLLIQRLRSPKYLGGSVTVAITASNMSTSMRINFCFRRSAQRSEAAPILRPERDCGML